MTIPSQAAEAFVNSLPLGIALYRREIMKAFDLAVAEAEDAFIQRLFTSLEGHGIDPANWDGDGDPAYIIATCMRSRMDESVAEAVRAKDEALTAVFHEVEGRADGTADATPVEQLCNLLLAIVTPALSQPAQEGKQ